jgi:hypothetical protein
VYTIWRPSLLHSSHFSFLSIAAEGPDSIYKLLERTPTLFLTVSLQSSFPELLGFSVSCRQVVMKP